MVDAFSYTTLLCDAQGIKGVRFKRVIMDESATDRSPNPPVEEGFKRLVLCSGKASSLSCVGCCMTV